MGRPEPLQPRDPRLWVVPLLCLSGLAVIWASGGNEALFLALNRLGPLSGDALWANLTLLGDTLVAITLGGVLGRRRPDILWALLLAAAFATLWVHGLKPLVMAPRPLAVLGAAQVHVIGPALLSGAFPSGHSATVFTLAGVFVLRGAPRRLSAALLTLALLAAVSRAVVGAHWPADLLAGALGGWLAAIAGVWLAGRWDWGARRGPARGIRVFFLLCALALLGLHDPGYPQTQALQWLIGAAGAWALIAALRRRPA